MNLIKIIISLTLMAILTSCSESVPERVTSNYTGESLEWKKWDCYDFGYSGKYLLTIGYIPELNAEGFYEGKLFLKDMKTPIDTVYYLDGVRHSFSWFNEVSDSEYRIIIDSDGTGRYWDFSGVADGEEATSIEHYECTSSGLEKFDKFMSSIW